MAQDMGVRAFLSLPEVGLNRQFVLNVEVTGTQQIESGPNVPDLSDFSTYLGSGTSTSMQIVNGRTTVSVTVQYRFQATKLGTFEIGSVIVGVGGKNLRTEPVTLTVTTGPSPSPGGRPGGDVREIAAEDLFVTATPSKRRVYVNEPVIVEYRIFTQVNVDSYSITQRPRRPGFWVEELESSQRPRVEQVVRDGKQYASAVIGRSALFPTSPGSKTIEPLSIQAQVRASRRSSDLFDDIFSRNLLSSRVPVVIATEPVEIEVVPLPDEGRPASFTGLVGDLDLSASLDKTQATTNEALTYRLQISGEGNLRTLPEPDIAFPNDFEVYPPELSESIDRSGGRVSGSRIYEYVLIPRSPGTRTIPSVEYGYFDGPIIGGRGRGAITTLREDIRFIRVAAPKFVRQDQSLMSTPGFWVVLLVPLVALSGAVGVRRHRDRLSGDVAYARGRRASRVAKQPLQGFLGDKLNIAEAGMIRDIVGADLVRRGVPNEVIEACYGCLDSCDRQRFAPADVTLDDMTALDDPACGDRIAARRDWLCCEPERGRAAGLLRRRKPVVPGGGLRRCPRELRENPHPGMEKRDSLLQHRERLLQAGRVGERDLGVRASAATYAAG
jgi:hypothetical protein